MGFPPTLVYMNGTRIKHRYSGDFEGWLRLLPTEEIEDIIGRETMNALVAKFNEENQAED